MHQNIDNPIRGFPKTLDISLVETFFGKRNPFWNVIL